MTRPAGEIRADLEHPHTRALLQVHSTSVGDGPIGRLLRDVEPLLAEVERLHGLEDRLGECIGCNYNDGPDECCPQHGRTVTEWIDIASTVIGRQHAIETERDQAQAECAELHDALDAARMVIDEAQAKIRARQQAAAWGQAAAAVAIATQSQAPVQAKITYGCGCVQHPTAPAGEYVTRCGAHRATGTAVSS